MTLLYLIASIILSAFEPSILASITVSLNGFFGWSLMGLQWWFIGLGIAIIFD